MIKSPRLLSGHGWLLFGLSFMSAACGACGSDPAPTPEELCDWKGPGIEVPQWTLERVYDLELRSQATDPSYILGTLELFVNKDGVSVFTRSGYIRTNLDGEVVSRLFQTAAAPVVQTSEGFAGYIDQGLGLSAFCLFSSEGALLEETCNEDLPLGDLYWRDPNIVIISWAPNFGIVRSIFDASGQFVEERKFPINVNVPLGKANLLGERIVLAGVTRTEDENLCPRDQIVTRMASETGGPFYSHPWPEGYVASGPFPPVWVEGPNSGIYQYRVQCLRGKTDSQCNVGNPELDVFAVFKKGSDTPIIKPQDGTHVFGLGYRQIWDGERFVGLSIDPETGTYLMRFANEEGDIIGEATWPLIEGLKIRIIGDFGFAAVSPGDYIITFSVPSPDNSDRIVRVRMRPPQ